MKKIIAIVLCLVMMLSLCGCTAIKIPETLTLFREALQFVSNNNVSVNVQVPVTINGASINSMTP